MPQRKVNCCCRNHPRPIFCCQRLECSQNEVVNPVVQGSFGFFNNTSIATYSQNEIIPLVAVMSQGAGVSSTSAGGVLLSAGTYQITYFAQGRLLEDGEISVGLRLNGQEIAGTRLVQSGQSGEVKNLSQTILFGIVEGSILEIVDLGEQNATFSLASLYVVRV